MMLQSAKIPKLDQVGRLGIVPLQFIQGKVECEQSVGSVIGRLGHLIEIDALAGAAGLEGVFVPSAVDKDAPHGFGGGGKEMAPTFPGLQLISVNNPQVGFMDQIGGLETLARRFPSHLLGREPAQLLVNQRQQLGRRLGIALVDGGEDTSEFAHSKHRVLQDDTSPTWR